MLTLRLKRSESIILFFAIIFIIIFKNTVHAQENKSDFQTGIDFRAIYTIDEKWTYDGNYGMRGIESNEDWRSFYINPSFVYNDTINLGFRGGIRFDYTREKDVSNTFEVRPWQGLRFLWPRTNFVIFSQYIRLEERFTWGTEDGSFDFVLRVCYRIMLKTPNLKWVSINQTFYFLTSIEFFADIGNSIQETYFDRNRLTFGIGYFITQDWHLEVNYILQGSVLWAEEGFDVDSNILRLKVRYYINILYQ